MNNIRTIAGLALVVLSGCTSMTTVKLYEGPDKNPDQIAMVYVDPHVVVSRVDAITEHPTDKSRALAHSAGKRREVIAIEPGMHELATRFFVLCRQSKDAVISFNVEAGKKYRLKAEFLDDFQRWAPSIVEYRGEPIDSEYPWMRALCEVKIVRY
jgi:hypothetical protein